METKISVWRKILWISGVLPFVIFNCALPISEPTFSNKVGRTAYVAVTFFAVIVALYRIKVKKIKVWRGVLDAVLIILLYLFLLFLWTWLLLFNGYFSMKGIQ